MVTALTIIAAVSSLCWLSPLLPEVLQVEFIAGVGLLSILIAELFYKYYKPELQIEGNVLYKLKSIYLYSIPPIMIIELMDTQALFDGVTTGAVLIFTLLLSLRGKNRILIRVTLAEIAVVLLLISLRFWNNEYWLIYLCVLGGSLVLFALKSNKKE